MRGAGLPVALLALDASYVILDANDECERLLGYASGALEGRRLPDLLPLAARAFFQSHVFPTLGTSGRVDEVYVSLRTQADEALQVILCAAAAPDGRIEIAFLPMRRRPLFERELTAAQEAAARNARGEAAALDRVDAVQAQLAISERLASIGTLAAAVAHEINNPLAYVSANIDLLAADHGIERAESAAILGDIQEGIARIRDIVASLKKLSRVDDVRREPVDLGRVVEVALKIAGAELRHRARLELDIEQPPPIVLGEEGRLVQVLINLLVNAAQALPAAARGDAWVRVTVRRREGDTAELVVADNGPGIPLELQQRIFEPFFTTKPLGEGTGLGLSVCHGILASLGGSISLDSVPGAGARFVIHLPAAAAPVVAAPPTAVVPVAAAAVAAAAAAAAAAAPARRLRVLVIDDDDGVGRAVRRVLRDHEVIWYASAVEALERFEAGGLADCDVVLCDLMMPGMTGMELHARFAATSPELAACFVFLSGGAFTDEARDFMEAASRRALSKPFDVNQLRRVVGEVASERAAVASAGRVA